MRPLFAAAGGVALAIALAGCGTGGISKGAVNQENGKKLFLGKGGCAGCHTLKAAGTTGTVGPNLDQLMPAFPIVRRQVTNGGAKMPAFKDVLLKAQIDAVAKYVAAHAGK